MLLENFTATLNKLMCYNENHQKHIHTFLVYFITIFPQKIKVNLQIYDINSPPINSPSSRPVVLVVLLTSKRLVDSLSR